jgi:condensin complex subunit 3
LHALFRVSEDLEEDEEMVSLSQIAMQLVDWTDPRRLVDLSTATTDFEAATEEDSSMRNRNIHVDVAIAIMEQMKRASSNPAQISDVVTNAM